MANYVPFFRSNYFQVKDPRAFEAFCKKWSLELIRGGDEDKLFGLMGGDEGGLPSAYYDAEKDDLVEGNFIKELGAQLVDGWVAIVREIGYEKMRYLIGFTIAVNAKGRTRIVNLDAIYKRAKQLGEHVTPCEY